MPEENIRPGPDHFRYVDSIGPEGLTVSAQKWVAYAETEKCWYLVSEYDYTHYVLGYQYGWTPATLKRVRKRVLKEQYFGSKCFAYPNKERALNSYKQRKQWQIRHATLSLERAQAALGYFGDSSVEITQTPDETVIPSEYIQGMGWGDC